MQQPFKYDHHNNFPTPKISTVKSKFRRTPQIVITTVSSVCHTLANRMPQYWANFDRKTHWTQIWTNTMAITPISIQFLIHNSPATKNNDRSQHRMHNHHRWRSRQPPKRNRRKYHKTCAMQYCSNRMTQKEVSISKNNNKAKLVQQFFQPKS